MKIAVFASGNGSNFEAIAAAFSQKKIAGQLSLVFCDQPEAYVLTRAQKRKIPVVCFSPSDFSSREQYEEQVLKHLKEHQIDLIVLAGYLRIIGKTLLEAYPKRIVNIHPSLLPSFPGLHGIEEAFHYGVKITGITIHYVDSGVDTGPIIFQTTTKIDTEDTLDTLTEKIHALEHEWYPKIISQIVKETMTKRALISVSDKTGVTTFAAGLVANGFEIISTGGTRTVLEEAGVPTLAIDDITGFPEMLDGRVKTLHPNIHGGLLAKRGNQTHQKALTEQGIQFIDLVVVNLYPFKETILKPAISEAEAIEMIDIGGPSMLRSAAKNYQDVTAVVDPSDYEQVLSEISSTGTSQLATRKRLAAKVFRHTAAYDALIADYLTTQVGETEPEKQTLTYERKQTLRYGENSHQQATFYQSVVPVSLSIASARQLHGKELSYNNIRDADAALRIASEFTEPTVVAVKHMNPCGIGTGKTILAAYRQAFEADPVSIFGGIVVLNRPVDQATAAEMHQIFLEIIIAPSFEEEALALLSQKKNLRLLTLDFHAQEKKAVELVSVMGGLLIQEQDTVVENDQAWQVVTERQPTPAERDALNFAWKAVKHVKSNAIVLANESQTVGIGAGQMNRIGSVKIAVDQAQAAGKLQGAVLASDAFFPMADSVEYAAQHGIQAIIQPGGSIKDQASIDLANHYGIAMIFTGTRHFKH